MNSTVSDFLNSFARLQEERFQRQADLIRHYKDHNEMLRRKVFELNRLNSQEPMRTPALP